MDARGVVDVPNFLRAEPCERCGERDDASGVARSGASSGSTRRFVKSTRALLVYPPDVNGTLRLGVAALFAAGLSGLAGCAMYQQDLGRARAAYDEARYDHALVWFDDLESQLPRMTPEDRAEFYFTRGMTYYRLGQRTEALHHLALAREEIDAGAASGDERREQLGRVLEELTPVLGTHRARRPLEDQPRVTAPAATSATQALDDERPPRD